MKRILYIFMVLVVGASSIQQTVIARAQNEQELQSIYNDTTMYDPNSDACSAQSATTPVNGNGIYVMGDSLTVGMNSSALGEESLSSQLAKSWAPTINAHGCRPVWYPNANQETSAAAGACAKEASVVTSAYKEFDKDKGSLKNIGTVVVALGTNKPETNDAEFKEKSLGYIKLLRDNNPNLGNNIYWVNFYSRDGSLDSRNAVIDQVVAETGIKLIDYRSVATDETTYPFQDTNKSQVHLNETGYKNKVKFIVSKLSAPTGLSSSTATGSYDPIALTYPSFPDEATIITKLKDHIKSRYSKSPFASNLNYVDSIFNLSKQQNINPLLVISIAQQENGYGGAASSATAVNNYFGITSGNGYRAFATVDEGIAYFINKISRHVVTPDGNYVAVRTFYEYIAVHQSGVLAYPGEYPPGSRGPDAKPPYLSGDPRMGGVLISWDLAANANTPAPYTNKTYNPGIYFENSIVLINSLTGLQLSNVPSRTGGSAIISSCSTSVTPVSNAPGQFTKTIDGFTVYKQYDPAWANEPYGDSIYSNGDPRTIESGGCGPSAMAMIITTLTGKVVTPSETSKFGMLAGSRTTSSDGGSDGVPLAERMASNWGLRATHIGANQQKIEETIKNGGYVIVSGQGGLPFTEGGHFVVIRALTPDGKWLVGDSSHKSASPDSSTVGYDPAIMMGDFTAGGYSAYAITK